MSWPRGIGIGNLLAYCDMLLAHLNKLVEYEMPVIMVSGDGGTAVPYVENEILLKRIYKKAHIDITVYMKPGWPEKLSLQIIRKRIRFFYKIFYKRSL